MNLKDAIIQSVPGTGVEIARKVNMMNISQANMVTPNVVYQILGKYGKANGIKREIIETPTGYCGAMQKTSYYRRMK